MKKAIVVLAIIAFSFLPARVSAYNHQVITVDLPDEMKGQPLDIHVDFQKPCYAVDEKRHSVRLLYNGKEIESQIYNLNFEGEKRLASCNLVFIYQGKGEYILEYGDEIREVNYKDHVKVNDIYYFIEPIPGYYAKVNCYEIKQDGKSIFGICQEGSILGIEMGNKVITMKEGAEKFEMKNWDQFFSFAMFHSDGNEKGSDEKLQGKKILVDGNLMVRVALETSSRDEKLKTSGIYTYYYSPSERRLFVRLKHESGEKWNGNITYTYLSSIHSTSRSIDALNMGRIMPYLHFNGEGGVEEYKLNTNPESREFQWIISSKDNVYTGTPSWVSIDDKKKAYALFFTTPLLVTAAVKQEINVPGLEVDGGGVNLGAFGETSTGVVYDGTMEAFIGDYGDLEKEGEAFVSLAKYRNFEGEKGKYEHEKMHNLSIVLGLKHSLPFSVHLSALLGIDIPHMEVEIWKNGSVAASGAVNFRKIVFQIPEGNYMVKVFKQGFKGRKFVGEKYVELKGDKKIKVWCTFQTSIRLKTPEGSIIRVRDAEGGIVSQNESTGEDIIFLPAMKKYVIQILYHGFLMHEKEIFPLLPLSIENSFTTYDFALTLKDNLDLPFAENVTAFIYSDDMVERENIYGVKKGKEYIFSSLPPASYNLVITYKGITIKKKVNIPDKKSMEIIIPAEYTVKIKTYDSRGFPLSSKIYFERGGKQIEGEKLPPGRYSVSIYKGGRKIAAREIYVNGDVKYDVVTKKFSPYPFIVPAMVLAFFLLRRRKEGLLAFLLSLSLLFPWWSVRGGSLSNLYILPPSLIEMNDGYGNIASLPSILIYALYLSLFLLIASIVLLFIQKLKKFSIVSITASLSIFLYTIFRFSSITVGKISGKMSTSSWGLGIGFYLALISLILILVKVIYDETGRGS